MLKKTPVPESLTRVIERQDGVVAHAQLVEAGLSPAVVKRLKRDGWMRPLHHGVYTVDRNPSWLGLANAGLLIGGPSAALGGQAAAHLYGWVAQPSVIDVWVERDVRPRTGLPWIFHRSPRPSVGNLSMVPPAHTVLDVCATLRPPEVISFLAKSIGGSADGREAVRKLLVSKRSARNRALILEALTDVEVGAMSPLEARYLRDVEIAHGLPVGLRQVSITRGSFTDVTYEFQVLVELDGTLGHTGTDSWRDYRRDNAHVVRGYITLRFGWFDVINQPCQVAAQVEYVLRKQGWLGTMTPCPRCTNSLQAAA